MKRKISMTIQYDGSNYHGWQIQPDRETIQGLMEETIRCVTGERVSLVSAGRTDAHVHALGQVAAFFTASRLSPETLKRAINSLLPKDIGIVSADAVSDAFHPRYDAKGKRYRYIIMNEMWGSPFLYRYVWQVKHPLELSLMIDAAQYFIGRHDYRSFAASGTDVKSTEREIFELKIVKYGSFSFMGLELKGDFIIIDIEADGFLRHMVRNIVGTLVDVGREKIAPLSIETILLKRDRRYAGPTAPGNGLFLERVVY